MLYEFLTTNHQELINRCTAKAAQRFEPSITLGAINHGAPLFLQQLARTLDLEHHSDTTSHADTSPTAKHQEGPRTEIGSSAALQGAELLRLGYSIEQVVHCYGDVCQAITGLAIERSTHISTAEFRTLNRCLDNAIAEAVAAFGSANQILVDSQADTSLPARLAAFAAEERRLVDTAMQSFSAIKGGRVGVNGATGNLLSQTLEELQTLVDRILPEIRVTGATIHAAPKNTA